MPNSVGSIVGKRYRLEEQLGSGSMGAVYRAVDKLNGDVVALKRILNPTDPVLRLLLAHEFQALASLHHPNIIGVRDYGFDEDGHPFFTMDYLPRAQTLLEAGEALPYGTKLDYFVQLLRALAYIHRRNVIHRDLKPNNVLISAGQVQVLDFGLALKSGQPGHSSGSLIYMAPEVLESAPARASADLYAAGILAYELFTGHYPFDTSDLSALIDAILSEKPDLKMLPPKIAPVIDRLLAKAPAARYPSASATLRALDDLVTQPLKLETRATRESFLQAANFVGRERELAQLQRALAAVRASEGSAWLIGGESGVGKSRLLAELRTHALVEGAPVLRGQAVREGERPYHLWRDIARWLAALTQPSDLQTDVLRLLIPDVERLLDRSVPPAPTLDPQATRARLLAVLTATLRRAAAGTPLVLLLDDVQWASASSLAILRQVTHLTQDLPLLLIASYQSDVRPDLPAHLPGMTPLSLDRLTPEAIAELSRSMLGETGHDEEIVAFLERESEGNTFFIVEVVRALAEEAGQLDRVSEIPLPEQVFAGGIRDVLTRRLAHLPEDARPLLRVAAVAGREVDLRLMRKLAPEEDLSLWLATCANAAVLDAREAQWHFAHNKLRDAILAEIPPETSRKLHRKVAQAIEVLYTEDLDTYAAKLAYHYRQAGLPEREYEYARRAGELAAAQYANAEALAHLNRAVKLSEELCAAGVEVTPESRYATLLSRVKVLHILGEREQEASDLDALDALARALDSNVRRAEAALYRADYALNVGDYPEATTLIEGALALEIPSGIEAAEIQVRSKLLLGTVLWRQGHLEEARNMLEQVLPQALSFPLIHAAILRALGSVSTEQSNTRAAKSYYERAQQIFHQIGDRYSESRTLFNTGVLLFQEGALAEAERHYKEALEIFYEVGYRLGVAIAFNNLGVLAYQRMNYLETLDYHQRGLAIRREIADLRGQALALTNVGTGWKALGFYLKAQAVFEEALTIYREIGAYKGESHTLYNMSDLYLALEKREEALPLAQKALSLAREAGARSTEANALLILGKTYHALNRLSEALATYRLALDLWQELEQLNLALETEAALAEVRLDGDDVSGAQACADRILPHLTPPNLAGTFDPFYVYWICYRVLQAAGDARARQILEEAHALLAEQAHGLPEGELRESFLQGTAARRAIVEAWAGA